MTNPSGSPVSPAPAASRRIPISGLRALDALAQSLAGQLGPGDVLALSGELGAGKTTFIQRLAHHLGVAQTVSSPTFVLTHEYDDGRFPLVHTDFYRLADEGAESLAGELRAILADRRALVVVEWAELGPFLEPFVTHWLHLGIPAASTGDGETSGEDGEPREATLRNG